MPTKAISFFFGCSEVNTTWLIISELANRLPNRPQYEALGNNYKVCGVYSTEPRSEVYCLRLNFNISKLVY